MEWLVGNWFLILLAIAFIAMHMFGHGGMVATVDIRDMIATVGREISGMNRACRICFKQENHYKRVPSNTAKNFKL